MLGISRGKVCLGRCDPIVERDEVRVWHTLTHVRSLIAHASTAAR